MSISVAFAETITQKILSGDSTVYLLNDPLHTIGDRRDCKSCISAYAFLFNR